nr:putative pre-mRNA-splicing factor ATP-dependent RNA helicase PRP1 [Lepeophtheirus salmonis]
MTTFQALLTELRTQFQHENEEIKNKIKDVEESLEWNEVPRGRGTKEFRMLNTREAKLKTIHTLREQLINNADEMEEFQRKIQEILAYPENMMPKLQREIQTFKKHLPIYRFRSQIKDTVQNYDVTILVADTGSGKSTLLPQFLHDHNEKHVIYCAQPRRLAANALADYTTDCLDVENVVAVDYSSWDTTYKLGTSRIVYTTNFGLLHKWRKDKYLSDVDIVVIDEAHERNLATDLLLGIMKEVITAKYTRNNPIKLVIMSATIDPSIFYNFFAHDTTRVKNLSIPGKTFPIDIIYNNEPISDNPKEYLERTLKKIKEIVHENEVGDILAFLATPAEIDECVDNLVDHFQKMERNIKAYPLHGNVESETQRALFKKDLNINEQRVILATKIAETSVTLPDISFVVDSGRQKEYIYDLIKNIGELSLCRISKSSGIQRAGRAGRVGPGVCYRLYTLKDFDDFVSCQSPQIKCLPLDESLLSLFDLGFSSPSSFHFIDPPDPAAIKVGITSLVSLNALDEIKTVEEGNVSYQLTTIGHKMAKFNIDPRLSHLIVNTIELERDYIYEILVICGMVSFGGNIFYRYGNIEAADIQKLKFCHPSGDFITMLEAYKRWIIVPNNEQGVWSKKNFVSPKALHSVRKFVSRSIKQIEKTYRSYNFANLKSLNFNHTNCYDTILKLIYNSFKRSVGIFAGHYKTGYLSPVTCEKMVLHGSSSMNKLSCELPQYICFDKVMTTTKTFIFHASAVKPEWIEDKDSLYTQFVKSSMVEHYTDFPKLGSKFLRYKIIRNIKSETPRLQEYIKNNSLSVVR